MVTKSSGSIQTTKSKPGQSCHLCALPNNAAATGNAENDLGMTESSDVSGPPQGTRAHQAAAIIARPCPWGGIVDGCPLLRIMEFSGHLRSSRHVQRVKGLSCQ